MLDQKQIILQLDDGDTWGIKQVPYAVIEVATEEDWTGISAEHGKTD